MACGVHLGILLIFLIQAEHVLCLWAQQARRQNGNTNVGFSQKGSGFGGSDPQNQLRRASGSRGSAQSSSLNKDSEVSSGYSQRFPSSGYTQGVSQPARRGYPSVRLVQSSSESKLNWPKTKLSQETMQKIPKKQSFGLSTNIAGGSSISKYDQSPLSKKRTWPVQQGTPSTSNYQSSSSKALQSSRESYSFKPASRQSAAQKASRLTSTGAAEPHRVPARTETSASASATRVYTRRGSVASKPSYFSSLQNERTRNNPSKTGNKYPSKPVPVNARNLPAAGTRSVGTSGQRFAPTRIHNIPQHFGGYAIRRLKEPADQKEVSVMKPQQAFIAPQRPSPQQQGYAAPQRPSPQQQGYAASQRPSPQQQGYAAPQWPSAPQWSSAAPQWPSPQQQGYAAPQRPSAPQWSSAAPQRPSAQRQSSAAPQRPSAQRQSSAAPQRASASYKPQVQSVDTETKWMRIGSFKGQ